MHTHASARAEAHTYTHTLKRTHACLYTHTHTHTHTLAICCTYNTYLQTGTKEGILVETSRTRWSRFQINQIVNQLLLLSN